MLIDTHCHIHFNDYADTTVSELIARAKLAGVEKMILIGTDFETNRQVTTLAPQFSELYCTLGLHPHDASSQKVSDLEIVRKLAAQCQKLVAIGEIGLDYYRNLSPKNVQMEIFEAMMDLACDLQLPIVVHDRDAHEDIYQMIKSKVQSRGIKGVIHCFSGDRDFAQKMMDLDFVLSFAGQITFKNAEVLRDAAKFVPLTSMLVETDSPYLTPVPHRGQRNEPAYVKFTAEKIAEIKQVSFEAVAQQTTANAQRVFKI